MTMSNHNRLQRNGAITVWLTLSLAVIVGIVALNFDGGRAFAERRRLQSIADTAALTAAQSLYTQYWDSHGRDPKGLAKAAAIEVARQEGISENQITVNIPPTSGEFAGLEGYAEVQVQTSIAVSFGRLFTSQPIRVHARSVGYGQPMKIGIIAMNPTQAGSFTNRALALSVINTPVIVNSNHPEAYRQESFGAVLASRFEITGGYSNRGGAIMLLNKIKTNMPPVLDPLAALPIPSTSQLSVISSSPRRVSSLLPTILEPGIYRGGLHLTGISVVVMLPGLYIMEGGGFTVDGLATVVGLGVTIYNTRGIYPPEGITIHSLGKIVLTAPLSGTYQGINFFQNRSMTNSISVRGVGLTTITGVIYALQAHVDLSGSAAVGLDILGGAYVVDTLQVEGIGLININLNLNPPRVPDVRIVQ